MCIRDLREREREIVLQAPAATHGYYTHTHKYTHAHTRSTRRGGQVREVDAVAGAVTIEYKGPAKLTFGLELTLKENPLIRAVTFV